MDNWVIIKLFSYLRLRQSRVKQEVDMPQIQKCVTRYSFPYWCSVPNIRKLASVVPEKNVTEIFCDADDDARRRIVIPLCRLRLSGQATQWNFIILLIFIAGFLLNNILKNGDFLLVSYKITMKSHLLAFTHTAIL